MAMRGSLKLIKVLSISFTLFFANAVLGADVLILRGKQKDFEAYSNYLRTELTEHTIDEVVIEKDNSIPNINSYKVIVALGNNIIDRIEINDKTPNIFVAMGLKLDNYKNKKIFGIRYETSIYSIVSGFNEVIESAVKNVGIIHRKIHSSDVKEATSQLAKIGVKLNTIEVEDDSNIARSIEQLQDKSDAIVVLLDSVLVNKNNFKNVWLNASIKSKMPFLCGHEQFTTDSTPLCAFAAFPDIKGMAQRSGQMLSDVIGGAEPKDYGVEYLIDNKRSINKKSIDSKGCLIRNVLFDNLDIK